MRKVSEKYTQNVTAPTRGFDCHVSKEFSTVISSTSSFLAFQRTQVRCSNCASPFLRCGTRPGALVPPRSSKQIRFSLQCYLYEFLGDGSDETVQCPSAARLYAIVSFSYVDPNVTHDTPQQRR